MENFIYSIPTTIYFGKGQIEHVAQAVRPYGKKALIVYGGGSVKKNGIFDRVTEILEHEGIAWEELGGVEPNPRIETVRKGAEPVSYTHLDVYKRQLSYRRRCVPGALRRDSFRTEGDQYEKADQKGPDHAGGLRCPERPADGQEPVGGSGVPVLSEGDEKDPGRRIRVRR